MFIRPWRRQLHMRGREIKGVVEEAKGKAKPLGP
jgi:hypothetical protein